MKNFKVSIQVTQDFTVEVLAADIAEARTKLLSMWSRTCICRWPDRLILIFIRWKRRNRGW